MLSWVSWVLVTTAMNGVWNLEPLAKSETLRRLQRAGEYTFGAIWSARKASLIVGKVYRTLSDAEAEPHDMLRVIDEDKLEPDGYLYPASMFVHIELPEAAARALRAAGK